MQSQQFQFERQKTTKDGWGPRGAPDCYYTSRTLNSTFRYVKFVNKLRAKEEEERKGIENTLKETKDKHISDFFIRCDRRSLINKVAHRVDLCLEAYQEDLKRKRQRLLDLMKEEEEQNIRKFVEQAQAGAEAVWQSKKERLAYLLGKRKKEHEDKYKDTPLSKCVHVLPCIYKLRAKEAQEIQLYQMKEKQARKMAEIEFDKMWHAVAMKESDALAARIEQDAIERKRRDQECKEYADYQLEQRRLQREREREMLKQEALRFKSIWEADNAKEEEAERLRAQKRKDTARELNKMNQEKMDADERQRVEAELIGSTWDSLAGQGLADELAEVELARRKQRELCEMNEHLVRLKDDQKTFEALTEKDVDQIAHDAQNKLDKRRCDYLLWSQKTNRDVRKAMIDQIKERQVNKETLKQKMEEENEYHRQLFKQLQELTAHKDFTDAQERKKHQQNLVAQIEYNKVLKERALQEEMSQRKKAQLATKEYEEEIAKMLSRPFFSEKVHPFMQEMAKGVARQKKCPCSRPDYCQ